MARDSGENKDDKPTDGSKPEGGSHDGKGDNTSGNSSDGEKK